VILVLKYEESWADDTNRDIALAFKIFKMAMKSIKSLMNAKKVEVENYKKIALNAISWNAIGLLGSQGIQFVTGLMIARLLLPNDYGLIGMLSVFMAVAQSLIDSGFGQALIQRKSPSQEDFSTVFYFNLAISISLYLILYMAAPAIAGFFMNRS
jgi:O-antigen/teichoic acid export membrane protein